MQRSNRVAMTQGGLALLAFTLMLGIAAKAVQPLPERSSPIVLQEQQQPPPDTGQSDRPSGESRLFTGTIVKDGSQLVFRDQSGTVYQLDDPSKAKRFESRSVKLTGKLEKSKQTIDIEKIVPANT